MPRSQSLSHRTAPSRPSPPRKHVGSVENTQTHSPAPDSTPQNSRSYGGYSTATHTTYTATRPSSPYYSLPSRRVTDVSAAVQPISPPYSPTRTAPATAPASSSPSAGGALPSENTSQFWAQPAHISAGGGSIALHQQQQQQQQGQAQRSRPASGAGMPATSEGGRPPSRPRSALVSRGGAGVSAGPSAGGASTASRGTAARALRALQATASRVASTAGQGPGAGQEQEVSGGGEGVGGGEAAAGGAYAQAMNSVQMLLSRVPGGWDGTKYGMRRAVGTGYTSPVLATQP